MKMIKKLLPLLLCMMMVVTAFAVAASAADGSANVSMTVSATEVNVGDTVTVTVSCTGMTVSSFGSYIKFDTDLLEITAITSGDPDFPNDFGLNKASGKSTWVDATAVSDVSTATANGQVGFVYAGTSDVEYVGSVLFEATFTAKAAGNVTFTLVEDSEGADGYKATAETKTLTIKSATPACEHKNTKAVSNGDGTHNVVCAVEDCGYVVSENVPHDFTTGTSAYTCICGAKFTGWDGDCYIKEAVVQKTGWTEIEDAWYYLDLTTGARAEGVTRVPYPTVEINGVTYAPNAEDVAYAENKGIEFIDATEAWFIFDENGKFQSDVNGKYEGPKATCYAVDGMIPWHYGLAKITNKYYYFVGDAVNGGNKVADGPVWVTRTNGVEGLEAGACYYFLGGVMANNLTDIVDGKYFENGKYVIGAGLVQVGEDYYYVRSSGKFATGKYYITNTNGLEGFETGMKLYFDEDGKMLPIKNGVVQEGGALYFYQNNHLMCGAGLIEYEGAIYYVRSSGKVATGIYYITNTNGLEGFEKNDKLLFGEDGKLIVTEKKEGIVEENNALYYYKNGRIAYSAGLLEIETGVYIYVRSNGQLATGEYYVTNVNGLEGFETGDKLTFGENGKLTAN